MFPQQQPLHLSLKSAYALAGVLCVCALSVRAQVELSRVEQSDQVARFHINNGEYLVDRGEYLEANAEFAAARDAATSRPLQAESLSWLGQMAATFLNTPDVAVSDYQEIANHYQDTDYYSGTLFQLGMLSYQKQDLKGARAWLSRFQKEFPQSPQSTTAAFMLGKIDSLEAKKQLPPAPTAPVIGKSIRVRLGQADSIEISAGREFKAPAIGYTFRGTTTFNVQDGNLAVSGSRLGTGPIELTADGPFQFKGRRYRGNLVLSVRDKQVQVVNRLPLEEYLYSVVGSEMPAKWPAEALKAQAIAARTYAAYHIANPPNAEYDLVDDTHDQEYEGIGRESPSTRDAVNQTAGIALGWEGRPILAAFSSNNGGESADSMAVFRVSFPYFEARPDPYSRLQPFGHWERQFSGAEIQHALADFGYSVPSVTDVRVAQTDSSGRAVTVDVFSGSNAIRMKARTEFRIALNRFSKQRNLPENIPETLFTIQKSGDLYTIAGGGWGHGVGMSQYGARARAEAGQDYATILAEYYPRTEKLQLY
jgi:stage II sporulation protein D